MINPLAIDLFCGLGGWSEGLLAEGWSVIGFDIERHQYGEQRYPAQLVLQDILTLHGSQFKDAHLIVASPPCQKYSYMAMPFSRGKAKAAWYRENPARQIELNSLFNACWRIQGEASEAAGRQIPMVVENVKGAQPWVGMARAHFGSFYLWGDVASVRGAVSTTKPSFGDILRAKKGGKRNPDGTENGQGSWFKIADSKNRGSRSSLRLAVTEIGTADIPVQDASGASSSEAELHGGYRAESRTGSANLPTGIIPDVGQLCPTMTHKDGACCPACDHMVGKCVCDPEPEESKEFDITATQRWRQEQEEGLKVPAYSDPRRNGGKGVHLTSPRENGQGIKQNGSGPEWFDNGIAKHSSKSNSRKAASAQIAKIPLPLAQWIARAFKPVATLERSA